MEWKCSTCGKVHTGLTEGYGYDAPDPYNDVPEADRDRRCFLDADYCVVDDEHFFVRGCVEIPIIGQNDPLIWGVWVSLSRQNFERERELVEDAKRVEEPPYFGWLSSRIEIYPDTYALKTNVLIQPTGMRPLIELEPTEHPLAVEQRTGITVERVRQIAELVEHGWRHPEWNSNQP